jgi:predicted GIY-YIG superfamily endonuclease
LKAIILITWHRLMLNEYPQEFVDSTVKPSSDTMWQDTIIVPYAKGISQRFRCIGNRYHLRTIFKTNGPVRDAQQTKQSVYSIPCDCGRCYIGATSRLLEVRIKEHKYNLTQSLLEKSELAQHVYEAGHKICWKEAKVLQVEPNATYRKYKGSATCLW